MVMMLIGPAGAGKSTVGREVSARFGWPLVDSDDYVEVHHAAARALERREHLVVACSGLTAHDRHEAGGDLPVRFVYLKAPRQVLESRLGRRTPAPPAANLHAQLLAFEDPDDRVLTVDASQDVAAVVETITRELGL